MIAIKCLVAYTVEKHPTSVAPMCADVQDGTPGLLPPTYWPMGVGNPWS